MTGGCFCRVIARSWVVALALCRITLAIACNIRRSTFTAQPSLYAFEVPGYFDGIRDAQVLRFLIDACVAIVRARVIAQKPAATAAATDPLNGLEHVGKIQRIVVGPRHYLSAQNVGFSFVLATELQKINSHSLSADLRGSADRASQNLSANTKNTAKRAVFLCLGGLRRSMPKRDVAYFVRHHSCHLAFVLRGLNHPAIHVHRPARQRKRIDLLGVDDLEGVAKFGMLKFRRD